MSIKFRRFFRSESGRVNRAVSDRAHSAFRAAPVLVSEIVRSIHIGEVARARLVN